MKSYYRELSNVYPLWFFTGYNSESSNYWNFYDTNHCRKEMGDMMLTKIVRKKVGKIDLEEIPYDFGALLVSSEEAYNNSTYNMSRDDISFISENVEDVLTRAFTVPEEMLIDETRPEEEREYKYGMHFGINRWVE